MMMSATAEPKETEGTSEGTSHYVNSQAKRVAISAALSSTSGSVLALGMDRDGTGVSNHMIIQNGTESSISLHEYYLYHGQAKLVPEGLLPSHNEDDALFHAAGGWASTGSNGIVTYQLDEDTYLHILWDCPYNFNHYCNFIGLYLCDKSQKKPTTDLFNRMEQYVKDPQMRPERCSAFDLVCCGPGERSYSNNGKISWGIRRPCEVIRGKFYATMTMGDSHKTSSTVTVLKTKSLPNFVTRNPK